MKDLTDLDYKGLFRDAVNMMAHIARAAGFDPTDPTVEPPAIVARVENLRAEVERLTAERTALLAPVEGVDLEEVLRLDREGTPAERWTVDTGLCGGCARSGAPALAGEVQRLTADLATARRLLPPRYVAADGSILDPERCTPHAPDCAECGRGRAHDEGCLALQATPAEGAADREAETEYLRAELDRARDEGARLTAELEEARLTLAAESGDIKGAPSARWTTDGHNWYGARPDGGMDKIERWSNLTGDGTIKHCRGWTDIDRFGFERDMGRFDLARAAMLAADAAHPSTPPASPE